MASSSDELHLTFKRSGGLFGKALTPLELDESELSSEEAQALAEALRSGVLERDVAPFEPGMAADEYQYDLVVRRGEQEHAFRFTEFSVPPELADLVRLLERRAEETERRRRSP